MSQSAVGTPVPFHNNSYRHREDPGPELIRLLRAPLSLEKHLMEDIPDVHLEGDVFITDLDMMPKMYRTTQIREVIGVDPLNLEPESKCAEAFLYFTSARAFDDFAKEPELNLYVWVADIALRFGYRRNLMDQYYTTFIKPFYEANPVQCLEILKDDVEEFLPVLLDPTLEIGAEKTMPLPVEKGAYLQGCVTFRYWLDQEPFSLLGVTIESIASVERRCRDVTREKIEREFNESD